MSLWYSLPDYIEHRDGVLPTGKGRAFYIPVIFVNRSMLTFGLFRPPRMSLAF